MIRLVIADDHPIVRGGLKQLFTLVPDILVAGEASNGAEVLAWLRNEPIDLLLLDLNMPGPSGADLIARLKAHGANFPILILSMHNEPEVAARALKAGASGYITKDCESEILLAAIRKVSAGGRYIAPELAEQIAFDSTFVEPAPLHNLLSGRELQVFRLLTTGKSVNDIAELLVISNKTVSTHKVRLMEKLNLSSVADLTRYAMQHKLLA